MKSLSKLLFGLTVCLFIGSASAQQLEIIPEAKPESNVEDVVKGIGEGGKVREKYNEATQELDGDLGAQMASGVFTWDTLLDYLVYLIKFLSQLGIFVGACFIIYAGYVYASSVFTGKDPSAGKTAITNSIIGVIIITFSYAIMKAVMAAFLN